MNVRVNSIRRYLLLSTRNTGGRTLMVYHSLNLCFLLHDAYDTGTERTDGLFPETYNLGLFKARVNKKASSLSDLISTMILGSDTLSYSSLFPKSYARFFARRAD